MLQLPNRWSWPVGENITAGLNLCSGKQKAAELKAYGLTIPLMVKAAWVKILENSWRAVG